MFKHNLTAVLNLQRPDKRGMYPLRIRSTIKRKVSYYSTGIMLFETEWDNENKKVIVHTQRNLINSELNRVMAVLEKEFMEVAIIGVSSNKAKAINNISFADYAKKNIKKNEGLWSVSTVNHKKSYLNKITEFKSNLKLNEVTQDLLTQLEDYCRSIKNKPNTIWSCTKYMKSVISTAVRDGTLQKNPLIGFKGTKYSDPMRAVLTQEEITLLEGFADNKLNNAKLRNVANWWILGSYTSLRYADLVTFNGLVNDRVLLRTQKTGSVVSILATEQIKKAIERITQPIFSNQKCNEYITAIMAIIGVDKKISFHCSRHSFGVLFIKNGGDVYKLSKLMGHSSVKTTMIYAQIANPTLDAEMEKVFKV